MLVAMAGFIQLLLLVQITQLVFSLEYSFQDESIYWINSSMIDLLWSNKFNNSTTIVFSSQESFLIKKDLSFNTMTRLHLSGSTGIAKINCTENTGIAFVDITNLHLEQLNISGCGNENQNSGVTITNCTNVTITRVTIDRSWTTGLVLLNTGGVVVIQNCSFLDNGFHIQSLANKSTLNVFRGQGGGMRIAIGNRQINSTYSIINGVFQNNTATDGGGMFLVIHEGAQHNNVCIEDTYFEYNKCENSGGGLNIEYSKTAEEEIQITDNLVVVRRSVFCNNSALVGGGTAFFSSQKLSTNDITFEECNWERNSASLGVAVDISKVPWERILLGKKNLPSPHFVNCSFTDNANPSLSDTSILAINGFRVQFSGTTTFKGNTGTCVEAIITELDFHMQSYVSFLDNHGIRGGAIRMNDYSVLNFGNDSIFRFINNTASVLGGAIYVQYKNKHLYFTKHKECFLHYKTVDEGKLPKNVTFEFEQNNAGYFTKNKTYFNLGDSIYVTYLTPCIKDCILPFFNDMKPNHEKCLGNFNFNNFSQERDQIGTSASNFLSGNKECQEIVENKMAMHFIPGKLRTLCIKLIDEVENETPFKVSVSILKNNGSVYNPESSHLTTNSLTLHGKPGDTAFVKFSAIEIRTFELTFKVVMDECPPGFVYDENSHKCECSNRNLYYIGIKICNNTKFQAAIQHGYWIGSIADKAEELKLASSSCPYGYCTKDFYSRPKRYIFLPENSTENMSSIVCNGRRKGVLCGSCRKDRSVYYNNEYFHCGSNDLCHLGWLFYILSELVPVTILFLIIIVFNISFTSGPLNGVIFFMQTVRTLKIQADSFIWFEDGVYRLHQVVRFFYSMFNLNFFFIDTNLSFCLWEGATSLDVLAFRYVTILYSLVLVIVTVFLLRRCNCSFCGKSLPTFKGSVIHGLSAFLVMSYSVCTRVSLLILTPTTLHIGPDYKNNPQYKYVVYYNGDYSYMGPEHLRYAIPAIFFIITIAIIPPLLLLSYPLCYKLFALLRIDESKFVQITCKVIPLEKIKPYFDSMQGAFKDRYRFFAGLYFLYRLVCLLSFALSDTFTKHYMLSGVLFALMLTAHAAVRPYKKGWQNLLEACLFFNLFTINAITFYNFYTVLEYRKENLVPLKVVQNVLILLPLLYLLSYIVYYIIVNLRSLCRQHYLSQETTGDSDAILDVLDSRDPVNDCEEITSYKLM